LFEAFTKKIVDAVKSKLKLWAHTAVFITVDEGDSGYVQPLDCQFFGFKLPSSDGKRL
jgi:phospholipase C